MTEAYYFNNRIDDKGRHEVHTQSCSFLPNEANRTYIGYHSNCKDALAKAKLDHPSKSFDGCFFCCNSCHKG